MNNETIYTAKELRNHITMVQRYLHRIQLASGDPYPIFVDGIFGSKTKQAVLAFQKRYGLAETGCVDEETWDALYTAYQQAKKRARAPQSPLAFPLESDFTLSYNDEHAVVYALQTMLYTLTHYLFAMHPCMPCGVYNEETTTAVRQMQGMLGLPETGETNRETWDAIVALHNSIVFHHLHQ